MRHPTTATAHEHCPECGQDVDSAYEHTGTTSTTLYVCPSCGWATIETYHRAGTYSRGIRWDGDDAYTNRGQRYLGVDESWTYTNGKPERHR